MTPRATLLVAATLGFSNLAMAQADLVALDAFASDAQGNPIVASQGDAVWISLRYEVRGDLRGAYTVRFDTPIRRMETPRLSLGQGAPGEYVVTWGPFPLVTARSFQGTATLAPVRGTRESSARNNSAIFAVAPVAPTEGIEWSNPRTLDGVMRIEATFNPRTPAPANLSFWLPRPATESFQTISTSVMPFGIAEDAPAEPFAPVVAMANDMPSVSLTQRLTAEVFSQRVNLDALSTVGFEAMFGQPEEIARWTRPERLVNSAHPDLIRFANQARTATRGTSIVEVAEALYQAVLRRSTYRYEPNTLPDALTAFRRKRGDCGALSSLFVALCRTQGIAARGVTGFAIGQNKWHVWAEFFVPGHGWVAVDPGYAEGLNGTTDAPLYFGAIPELNQRVATNFGFDKAWNGQTVPFLQAPSFFWSNPSAKLATLSSTCALTVRP